jgi:hypothetical protein
MLGPDRDEPLQENRDKSDAARSPVPPHHMAARCRFEAIRRQIKIGRAWSSWSMVLNVMRATAGDGDAAVRRAGPSMDGGPSAIGRKVLPSAREPAGTARPRL